MELFLTPTVLQLKQREKRFGTLLLKCFFHIVSSLSFLGRRKAALKGRFHQETAFVFSGNNGTPESVNVRKAAHLYSGSLWLLGHSRHCIHKPGDIKMIRTSRHGFRVYCTALSRAARFTQWG
jgi:hypothetical protein